MSETEKTIGFVQIIALLCTIGLFIADFGLGVMAKAPPMWAYVVPGLLGLGVEFRALRRLLVQAVRAWAKIPVVEKESGDEN